MAEGHPFCLVKHEKDKNGRDTYQMDEDIPLSLKLKDKHVAVISIAGKYREGKSFLMSLILRYLNHQEVRSKFRVSDADANIHSPPHVCLLDYPIRAGKAGWTPTLL